MIGLILAASGNFCVYNIGHLLLFLQSYSNFFRRWVVIPVVTLGDLALILMAVIFVQYIFIAGAGGGEWLGSNFVLKMIM